MKKTYRRHRPNLLAPLRRVFYAFFILLPLIGITLYAATPRLVEYYAPSFAQRVGLQELELSIAHPTLQGVDIKRAVLRGDGFIVHADDARLDYDWRELRDGRVKRLSIVSLDVELTPSESAQQAPPDSLEGLVPNNPFAAIEARSLVVRMPRTGFVGRGRAGLDDAGLTFNLEGIEPAVAGRFAIQASLSRDGVFDALFGERGDTQVEFLVLKGKLSDGALQIDGRATLRGYPLQLASELARLPPGDGSVKADISTTLPWPLPDALDWRAINATLPSLAVDWRAADGSIELRAVRGSVSAGEGAVIAALDGDVRYSSGTQRLSARLSDRYPVRYHDGVLSGRGIHARIQDTDVDVRAATRKVSISTSLPHKARFDVDIDGRVNDLHAQGKLGGNVNITDVVRSRANGNVSFDGALTRQAQSYSGKIESTFTWRGDAVDGNVSFDGAVQLDDQRHSGRVASTLSLRGDALDASGTLSSGAFDEVAFTLNYNLASGAGRANASKRFDFRKPAAAQLVPDWQELYDLDAGKVDAVVALSWQDTERIGAEVTLDVRDGRAHFEEYLAAGIDGRLVLRNENAVDKEGWRLEPTVLRIARIDVGLVATDGYFGLAWSGDTVQVSEASAALLGGAATTQPFVYRIAPGAASFDLRLENIDLAKVLALEGDDVLGTGRLDGLLPVTIANDQASVTDGSMTARPPGGTIRLSPTFTVPGTQGGLSFALNALHDFNYSELRTDVDYATNGDLKLAIKLRGRNPSVEKGRPIHYNLTISENLPVLLRSLRLKDTLTERIEKSIAK